MAGFWGASRVLGVLAVFALCGPGVVADAAAAPAVPHLAQDGGGPPETEIVPPGGDKTEPRASDPEAESQDDTGKSGERDNDPGFGGCIFEKRPLELIV